MTSSRETVTKEPVQPTASIVLLLAGNRKLSEETVAGTVGFEILVQHVEYIMCQREQENMLC